MSLFPDQVMAKSAMDRLAHRAHHVAMKGDSYRKKSKPKNQNEGIVVVALPGMNAEYALGSKKTGA